MRGRLPGVHGGHGGSPHDANRRIIRGNDVQQVLVFSPFMPVGHPVVTLDEFAAFRQLELLSVLLQPSRGWESGWRCEFSPALQGQSAVERPSNEWMSV
jgi:hypothetical protein